MQKPTTDVFKKKKWVQTTKRKCEVDNQFKIKG